ncbi:hypothetical protein CKM354_000159600 [Cercospora kikuchii]|uniref:Uncharacterized protein n=1 Tax=Cercospora kikuchii TaxID=84275 RepID=A0A9P3CGD7_9PEZI|nr:uncharacterized protein CKM354_000159600 [Cercospora kikuchii]GIZ38173.1 hypothetical protein CKM354_000159600 [Cercospora kikuchii]
MAQQVSSQDLERAMQTHNFEDSEIDQLMAIDISVGSSDQAASVPEPSAPDLFSWSAEIDEFMAAIITVFQNPECCNLSDQAEFWTAVLAFLNPDHEVFQALNPVREIQKVYKRLRAPAMGKYGDMADLRGLFAKGKKKRAKVLNRLKQDHAGPGENKPVQGKHQQGERLQREKALRKKQRRAVKREKRKMFHLQGLGEALPKIEPDE